MKKFNLFAMGLLAAATVSFTACSSNDDLSANGNNSGESKANGFYMTLTVQSPTSTGTRTDGNDKKAGSSEETTVNTGILFLVDQNGKTVFSKEITTDDWKSQTGGDPTVKEDGTLKTIKLEVNLVTAGSTYNVYFLANPKYETVNGTDTTYTACWQGNISTPWENDVYSNLAEGGKDANKFSYAFSMNNYFAMFNQNDSKKDGKGYTVTFTEKNKTTPAEVMYGGNKSNIYLDRIVARIDQPTSTSTIAAYPTDGDASQTYKDQMAAAKEAVSEIALQKYAISNLPTSTYAMQHWDSNNKLVMPSTDITYQQDYDSFGDETKANGLAQFVDWSADGALKNYVLENAPVADADAKTSTELNHKCTAMYFQYKVTLNSSTYSDGDIQGSDNKWDGTFYRYNGVIYTKLADIFTAYNNVAGWKGFVKLTGTSGTYTPDADGTTYKESEMNDAVTALKGCLSDEANLSTLRQAWGIEVFRQGLCYYKQIITDQNYSVNAIHRNTIYKLDVKNIYNIGADVPNGTPTENAVYYMNVGITANQWVMSTQAVEFK